MAGGAFRDRRDYNRVYRLAHLETEKARSRRTTLRQKGLTEEEFAEMLDAQAGRCAICLTDTPGGRWNQWHVDHDHAAEGIGLLHVRGLVCDLCNRVLGYAKDNPDVLRRAAGYLERTNLMITSTKVVNS